VWSAGCVLYEILTLKPPFEAPDLQTLFKKVCKGSFQKIPRHYSSDLTLILKLMLQVKPENRPTCD
jgi:NIMA (never in mitosis gene a)-related kinase